MKKLICAMLCLVMLLGLAVPAMAAEDVVAFTSDSSFAVGGTATIDTMKTRQNIMSLSNVTSEVYNAALEGNIEYVWYRNDLSWGYDESYTFVDYDKASQFQCYVYLFEDSAHTKQCGVYKSQKFTIPDSTNPALYPTITTESIPGCKVGEKYYFKLECTEADVVYSIQEGSLPTGLYLTQHGEIEGQATLAGEFYVTIKVTPELGEQFATNKTFVITIEDTQPYMIELLEVPNKLTYYAGEKLDMTGLHVRVTTPDGTFESKNGDKLTYSNKALVTLGEQKIKISYQEAFEFFIVTVVEAPATTPTTEATEQATEATTVPEETTEAATEEVTEATEEVTEVLATDPTEEPQMLDGPGSEGPTNSGAWIIWLVVGICGMLILAAAAVIVIVIVSKRKTK